MRYLLLIVLMGCLCSSYGQKRRSKHNVFASKGRYRHTTGMQAYHGFYGLTDNSELFGIGGMMYVVDNNAIRGDFSFEKGNNFQGAHLYSRYVLDGLYAYSVYDFLGRIYLNPGVGLSLVYTNSNYKEVFDPESSANLGIVVAPEIEIFLLQDVSVYMRVDQRLYVFETWGRWLNYNVFGVRYNIK